MSSCGKLNTPISMPSGLWQSAQRCPSFPTFLKSSMPGAETVGEAIAATAVAIAANLAVRSFARRRCRLLAPIKPGVADGVDPPVHADDGRRVGFADPGGQRKLRCDRVVVEVPDVDRAVLTVADRGLVDHVDGDRVHAPLLDGVVERRDVVRIGCLSDEALNYTHDVHVVDEAARRVGIARLNVWIENGDPIHAITASGARVIVVLAKQEPRALALVARNETRGDDRPRIVPAEAARSIRGYEVVGEVQHIAAEVVGA